MFFLRYKKQKAKDRLGSLALKLLGGGSNGLSVAEDVQDDGGRAGHNAVDDDSKEPREHQGQNAFQNLVEHCVPPYS